MTPVKSIGAFLLILATGSAMANNMRPIIGSLWDSDLEVSSYINEKYDNQYHSIIAASYVKFVEGAGARVVPIWIGKPASYYRDIMSKINGVLLPGGIASFRERDGFADAASHIYRIAKEMNEDRIHFPILGICLGFEVLVYIMSGRSDNILTSCDAENIAWPLNFTTNAGHSRMFKYAPEDIIDMLKTEDLTFNVHRKCVTMKKLNSHNITDQFRVLSTNRDRNGREFISSLEVIGYPFYGLQFHPEKNLYEWKTGRGIPHGDGATRVSQYFANFFVKEARKNNNHFENEEEVPHLIYNYRAKHTAREGIVFQQSYLFKRNHGV